MSRFEMPASGGSQPPWFHDDRQSCGTDFTDPERVAAYDQAMSMRDIAAECREIMTALDIGSASRVLEIGCGTGAAAAIIGATCRCLHACDVSPAMVAACRERCRASERQNVVVHERGFLDPPPLAGGYDAAYSQLALHHLNDFWKTVALQRLHAVLRPRARIFLRDVCYGFEPAEHHAVLEAWCAAGIAEAQARGVADAAADWYGHVREEHSTYTWLLTTMIERCGFAIERVDQTSPCIAVIIARRRD